MYTWICNSTNVTAKSIAGDIFITSQSNHTCVLYTFKHLVTWCALDFGNKVSKLPAYSKMHLFLLQLAIFMAHGRDYNM